jgi:hypothetical protein
MLQATLKTVLHTKPKQKGKMFLRKGFIGMTEL